ncbi:MAG: isoprenylcysteine carboxylmethyltransferase family protein [Acidobacteria bacterium]|nr:isoprenylcysteine carboxylmethyltransferase family protein [Acidobacteriota bacterium]
MSDSRFPKRYADAVARLRVPSGFLLLAVFGWLSRPTLESLPMGVAIALLGLILRGWAAGHLAKNQKLVDSGPYRFTRNPLYLGTLIAATGLAVAARSWAVGGVVVGVFLLVYLPVMELEEQHLRKLFAAYGAYADAVPLLLPGFGYKGSREAFRWPLYRKNEEYQFLGGFLAGVVFLYWRAVHAS